MPSSDSTATAGLSGHERLLVAVGAGVILFVLVAVVFGFGGVFGVVGALLYFGLMLGVTALVLWLFYRLVVAAERLVVAAERLADAQQRIASQRPSTLERG